MKQVSILADLKYGDERPAISVLFESQTSKEIRILLKAGQIMKEHKTTFPITVELFEGTLDFGVEGTIHHLTKGDLLSLDANIPHDLKALSDSIVRLTLSKGDVVQRVVEVAKS
ncbi:MAG: hypothetical protein JEZ14_13315 [Marinilabiliaceae bacterium]|nr:hypothetical protein [Marinilabiliaceae bacterium]